MGNFIPVEPEKWAEMVKALALVAEMDKTINASQAECRRLKAEVERLEAQVSYDNRTQLHVDKLAAEFTQYEVEKLRAEVERLTHLANQSEFYRLQLQKDTCRLENIQMQDAFKHYEAENARLKAEVERLKNNCDCLDRELDREIDKTAMLCGQVERLRKAGDAMYESKIGYYGEQILEDMKHHSGELCRNWNAAKEGKPSV